MKHYTYASEERQQLPGQQTTRDDTTGLTAVITRLNLLCVWMHWQHFNLPPHNFHSDISELNTQLGINFFQRNYHSRESIGILFTVCMQSQTNRWLPLMTLLVK